MVTLPWFTVAVMLLLSTDGVVARPRIRLSSSPNYRNFDQCPQRCADAGPNTGNWSTYPSFKSVSRCEQTMFFDFSLYDPVDDPSHNHDLFACSSFGPDFDKLPATANQITSVEDPVDVQFEIGYWNEGFGLAVSSVRSLIKQMRAYAERGHGATDSAFMMFGRIGQTSVGLYIGKGLQNQGLVDGMKMFEDRLQNLNFSTPSLAMQLCGPEYDSTHTFGLMITSNGTFAPIQDTLKAWDKSQCLSFEYSSKVSGQATFTTPLISLNGTANSTLANTNRHRNNTLHARHDNLHDRHHAIHARTECGKTVQVGDGDICETLAIKCGLPLAAFSKIHPEADFCLNLMPKQHVCCTAGTLPDFSPKPNSDGSCNVYTVKANDNCDSISAEYSLSREKLSSYNKNTWGWNGCSLDTYLFPNQKICLSTGSPPFPEEIANAQCGPQKPGTQPPPAGTNITEMNPCPLNACCNIWGQCGLTKDYCVDTNTGSPGTAKKDTFGCISNYGMDIIKGDGSGAIKVAYFEGYGFGRKCLFQDASQVDTSLYTNLHFGFGTLTANYEVGTGDVLSTYQFGEFSRLTGVKKILSFGGWDFSTMPATYMIFRNGVTPANRLRMATNIADFIKKHKLDGVDIDWEYPGAPDIPGIPAGSKDDGKNYLAFLATLKNLLPGKSVSIAAPASYWYLKQFPIKEISKVVDYIVFMTYDLHGQWDATNSFSQEGCDNGSCLRSQVNLTETKLSLAMITKAGVPGSKVIVGVTSYGRSYKMAQAGCSGPSCQYTGDSLTSYAAKGPCTDTAGYISNAEIGEIMSSKKRSITKSFVDASSNSDILIYDDTEWVSYMSDKTKQSRSTLYKAWGMGGTTDWASDLQEYHDVPAPATSWAQFKLLAASGSDPKTDHSRNGNWTSHHCQDDLVVYPLDSTPAEKWHGLDADGAWSDIVRIWKDTDAKRQPPVSFTASVGQTIHVGTNAECGSMLSNSNCEQAKDCDAGFNAEDSGAAGELIWDSMVFIHQLHKDYHDTLFKAASTLSTMLDKFEDTFAPIPPAPDDMWINFMIDLITLGTVSSWGTFIQRAIKDAKLLVGQAHDDVKEVVKNTLSMSGTITKDLLPLTEKDSPWTPEKQKTFTAYMGEVINIWGNVTSQSLKITFDGSDNSITRLGDMMSGGKLVGSALAVSDENEADLRTNVLKTVFGFGIPALWSYSNTHAFVIDSGYGCDEAKEKLSKYLDADTADASGVCIDGRMYYLSRAEGKSTVCKCEITGDHGPCQTICRDKKFTAPSGVEELDGEQFGGIKLEDLVRGSVNTYNNYGGKNGAGAPNVDDDGTFDLLLQADVTTPGMVRLPVCSPERAFQAWGAQDTTNALYPCNDVPGKSHCGESTFEDQTSDASPSVDDCRQIIKNIQGDKTTEWSDTQVIGHRQREIAKFGSCSFGVEASKTNGNVNFQVGGQDVIDIINDSINQFGGGGKIGAKGHMSCNGNVHGQDVTWGIY